jgi:protein kinase A
LDSPALQLRRKIRDAVENVPFESLEKIRLLGEGEFGEVWLVAADVFQTGVPELRQNFALKTQFRTGSSRGEDATADIMREINILKEIDHPQVVDLVHTYTDEQSIHMLMGLVPGGELWDVIHKEDEEGNWISGLSESNAKFVTLVISDILNFMHSRDIVYRDLKPENIMIDADGYPVLVDFGFAKYCRDKTFTFVGTPNYVAPEIIKHAGHNRSVDYWALGVTVYEMVTGENPFFYEGMDQVSLYVAICDEDHYPLSEDRSEELKDFVVRILEKSPTKRLGMLAGGCDDLFQHPWLSEFDLNQIRVKAYPSPWNAQVHDDEAEKAILQQMGMGIPIPSLDDSTDLHEVHDPLSSKGLVGDDSIRSHSNISMSEGEEVVAWVGENPSMDSAPSMDSSPSIESASEGNQRPIHDVLGDSDGVILDRGNAKESLVPSMLDSLKTDEEIWDLAKDLIDESQEAASSAEPTTKRKKKTEKKKSGTKMLSPKKSEKKRVQKGDTYQFVTPSDFTYFNIKDPKKSVSARRKQEESRNRRTALKGALKNVGIDSSDDELE